jgi:hypothetical protein
MDVPSSSMAITKILINTVFFTLSLHDSFLISDAPIIGQTCEEVMKTEWGRCKVFVTIDPAGLEKDTAGSGFKANRTRYLLRPTLEKPASDTAPGQSNRL